MKLKGIGIFPNLEKPGAPQVCEELVRYLEGLGEHAVLPPGVAAALGLERLALPVGEWRSAVRLVLVLGGDGTILAAARELAPQEVPLLGINFGRFGFLSQVEPDRLFSELPSFLRGDFFLDRRLMLRVEVLRGGDVVFESLCLNEVCVLKGLLSRMAVLSVFAEGTILETYFADGVIVATPTGSTAYSLSAGGPVLHPSVEALVVTPVCPHTLGSRSIVAPATTTLRVQGCDRQEMHLSVDGQVPFELGEQDVVVVKAFDKPALLARSAGWSFYDVLRRKMKEGGEKPSL